MAVFDAVVNNADRKIGHLLPAPGGHLYGCDHGVCFAEDYKLRTVLWQWRGKQPAPALGGDAAPAERGAHRGQPGRGAVRAADRERDRGHPDQGRRPCSSTGSHPYPPDDWPAVPWPPI